MREIEKGGGEGERQGVVKGEGSRKKMERKGERERGENGMRGREWDRRKQGEGSREMMERKGESGIEMGGREGEGRERTGLKGEARE